MNDFDSQIRQGTRLDIHGAQMEICYCNDDTVRYAACVGGTQSTMPRERLLDKLSAGSWTISYVPPNRTDLQRNGATLSNAEINGASLRQTYLRRLKSALGLSWPTSKLKNEILTIARELGDEDPPHPSTVHRWRKIDYAVGSGMVTLALQNYKKGGFRRYSNEAEQVIEEALRKYYLTSERRSVKDCRDLLIGELAVNDRLEQLFPKGVPQVRTFQRRAELLDGFEKVAARHGLRKARRMFKASGRTEWTTRILEMVQADGQLLDVLAVPQNEAGKPIAELIPTDLGRFRPYLTVLIDLNSRVVLSFVVTAAPFSTCTVLLAIKKAVVPDGEEPRGIPESLTVDNGSDYISDGLKRAAARLGFEVAYSQPYTPDNKAVVERFIQELTKFIHTLPGTVYSSPADRGEYPSQKLACLTLSQLEAAITAFIAIYNRQVHGTTKRAPIEAWRDDAKLNPPRTVSRADADAIARVPHRRIVREGRVKVEELEWFSQALATYEQSMRLKGQKPYADVLIDESDLYTVLVHPLTGDRPLFLAESTKPQYTKGLTMFEHKLIQAERSSAGEDDRKKLGDRELEKRKYRLRENLQDAVQENRKAARKAARVQEAHARKAKEIPGPEVPHALAQLEALPEVVAPVGPGPDMGPIQPPCTSSGSLPAGTPPAPKQTPPSSPVSMAHLVADDGITFLLPSPSEKTVEHRLDAPPASSIAPLPVLSLTR